MPRHQDDNFEGRRRPDRGYGDQPDDGRDRRPDQERRMGIVDDRRYEDEPWSSRGRGAWADSEREWSQREGRGAPRYIGERGEMSRSRGDFGQGEYWQSESDWRDRGGYAAEAHPDYGQAWRQRGGPMESGGFGERGWQPERQDHGRDAWQQAGPYAGRGPKGYQRSDERIREDVCEHLTQHGQIDASEMEIKVSNRQVTLTGSVPTRSAKRMAEDVVEAVSGVTEVHNQLRIAPEHTAGQTGQTGAKGSREHRAA